MIHLLILIIVIGILVWLLNTYIPMYAPIKTIVNIIAIVYVVWRVLKYFEII